MSSNVRSATDCDWRQLVLSKPVFSSAIGFEITHVTTVTVTTPKTSVAGNRRMGKNQHLFWCEEANEMERFNSASNLRQVLPK